MPSFKKLKLVLLSASSYLLAGPKDIAVIDYLQKESSQLSTTASNKATCTQAAETKDLVSNSSTDLEEATQEKLTLKSEKPCRQSILARLSTTQKWIGGILVVAGVVGTACVIGHFVTKKTAAPNVPKENDAPAAPPNSNTKDIPPSPNVPSNDPIPVSPKNLTELLTETAFEDEVKKLGIEVINKVEQILATSGKGCPIKKIIEKEYPNLKKGLKTAIKGMLYEKVDETSILTIDNQEWVKRFLALEECLHLITSEGKNDKDSYVHLSGFFACQLYKEEKTPPEIKELLYDDEKEALRFYNGTDVHNDRNKSSYITGWNGGKAALPKT